MNHDGERQVFSLERIRAEGWFDRLKEDSTDFAKLAGALGDTFTALTLLAGARIVAVSLDRSSPTSSFVEFVVTGTQEVHSLPLLEFRHRITEAILTDEDSTSDVPDKTDDDSLQAFIGVRYVLLAPLYGISLNELHIGGGRPTSVTVRTENTDLEWSLSELRGQIRQKIREEHEAETGGAAISIDIAALPKADEAFAKGQWKTVIELLSSWPAPLSILLRTADGRQLPPEARAVLARALGLLGAAYAKAGHPDWADEVMRLAIQWAQDSPVAAEIYLRLGRTYMDRGRHGEAIGLLRRSITLGAPRRDVLPLLTNCYTARKRYVAACVCAEEALSFGAGPEDIAEPYKEALIALGPTWTRFRELIPVPRSIDTLRAPKGNRQPGKG